MDKLLITKDLTHFMYEGMVPCIMSSADNDRIQNMDRNQMVEELVNRGIRGCIEPGIDLESNYKILEFADKYPDFLYPAVGVHPTRAIYTKWAKRKELVNLANNSSVIAIGETGLDYHCKRSQQHRIRQKIWFIGHLRMACVNNLPLILHIRVADKDAIKILRLYKNKLNGGVCHCFNQGLDVANIYTKEFGFMLGIGGSLLQDNCEKIEQTVRQTPLEHLSLETDGSYVKLAKPENVILTVVVSCTGMAIGNIF